jgi:hypothetical protein
MISTVISSIFPVEAGLACQDKLCDHIDIGQPKGCPYTNSSSIIFLF